jgi:hypothetical protein
VNQFPGLEAIPEEATRIFRTAGEPHGELLGYVTSEGAILRVSLGRARAIGRADAEDRIYRTTTYGERELGQTLATGEIVSAGLLEGGTAGWMDPDGVVIQGGLILGEEEVGRVEGPRAKAAAAALLLLFLPDAAEHARRSGR